MGKIALFLMITLVLVTSANARTRVESIDIKENFEVGETISFQYEIFSDSDGIVRYVPGIICEDFPQATLDLHEEFINGKYMLMTMLIMEFKDYCPQAKI